MKFSGIKFSFMRFRGKLMNKKSPGSFGKEILDINEEYMKAFRTQSYLDICDKVQNHITFDNGSSSSSIHTHYIHLCDIFLEPQTEAIANLAKTFNLHHLLLDFFESGLQAWIICEELLESIHQVNTNHHKVKRLIKLAQRVPSSTKVYEELASYSSMVNPLSDFTPEKFPKIHINHKLLLNKLTTNHTRITRKRKVLICLKKCGGFALIASYTVLAITLIVLACHGLVVTLASPGLIACFLGLFKTKKGLKTSELKRVGSQMDVAAKGIYTLIKDLDTMCWLVGRLHDEVEFGKVIARKCVGRKFDLLEEVMREFRVHDSCFLEQKEELEDHIYLCLLNVNRSRRLLVDKIMPTSQN
ncbi:unnamed protein product [Lactuca virosa]|uniref:Uncharacterized protein n=1 Tax=Lactuca virosa TaxID=75947 RepID=A0AAU9MZ03_9ASTR|nr:unnamed protein product [Lactuca virosa]